jgi:prepilin-type processing-associated H-X9-DG protein
MRRPRWLTWIFWLLVIPAGAAAILFPMFAHSREKARRSSCQSNLKQIGLAVTQYMQDYNTKFPPASVSNSPIAIKTGSQPYGWADAIQPYLKSVCIYQCPSERTPPNAGVDTSRAGYTDYWFNGHLFTVRKGHLSAPGATLMLGDGDGREASSARYSKTSLPPTLQSRGEQEAWPLRHLGGANYAFADGHVSWLRPDQITTTAGQPNTFAVR